MGTSGTMSTSSSHVKYNITINQNSQSIENNCSNVTVSVYFWRDNSGYTTYGSGTVWCKINGTTYSASVSSSQKTTDSGITLFSKTLDIYHNSDGTKTLDTSAWISLDTPLTSSEQGYSQTLTTIPRASQITLNSGSVTMGNSITAYTNRVSSSFTHILYYQIGSASWTWIASNISNNYTWTVPVNFANNVPSSTSLSVKLWLETYSGSTFIGNSSSSFTASVPSSVVPVINSVSLAEAVSGIASQFGAYVQSKSKISVNIGASGAYSSTIASYSVSINGASYTSNSFITDFLSSSGSNSCTVTITDSRNRTASTTVPFTVVSYSSPVINSFAVSRCNSDGTVNDEGNCAKCVISASISSVNDKNTKLFQILYKKLSDISWNTVTLSSSSYLLDTTQIIQNIDTESEYNFKVLATDYFGSAEYAHNLSTAYTIMDFNQSGKSIAFGQVSTATSTDSKIQIKMNVDLNGDLSITNSLNTLINMGLTDVNTTDFSATSQANWLSQVQSYVVANLPYRKAWIFNAGYSGVGYGTAIAWSTSNLKFLMVYNDTTGVRFYKYLPSTWKEVSATGATVLYSNTSGTSGTITLSETAANFSYIEIYTWGDGFDITKVYNPNGKKAALFTGNVASGVVYMYFAGISISGTSITWSYQNWAWGSSTLTIASNTAGKIYQVIGYR